MADLSWRLYINENKWRAVRYGTQGNLIDFGLQTEVPMRDLAAEIIELVDDVVDDLGSREEVNRIMDIFERGTSADRQLSVYYSALDEGRSRQEALVAVVGFLMAETARGW